MPADGSVTAAVIANAAIDAATFAADVDAEILSYLVDDATKIDASALNTASTLAAGATGFAAIDTVVDAILVDTGTTLPATLSTIAGYLDTEIAAILADTNELQADWVDGGRLDLILDAILADTNELQTDWADGGRLDNLLDGAASAGDPWTTALPGAYGPGTAGEIIGDLKNGERLDLIFDTIAQDTTTDIPALIATAQADLDIITGATGVNLLVATQATIDAIEADTQDLQTQIGTAGDGLTAVVWNAAWDAEVRAAVGLASANLDTQLGDIPTIITVTNKLDTTLVQDGGVYDFTAAALAAAPSGGASAAAIADAVWDEILADHNGVGSTGAALAAAGGSGDPWSTALPGAYGAGTAGYAIGTYIDAKISEIPANVRIELTTVAADVAAAVTGANISRRRGDTWSITITDMGDITGRSKLWLSVKELNTEDADDSDALLQITEGDGLLILNRETAGTSSDGSITVDDEADGDITVAVKAAATATLPRGTFRYDVQVLNGGNISTLSEGQFSITADVTRKVS
jgi:hypothetical protein